MVNLGVIGLGDRGAGMMIVYWAKQEDCHIQVICDFNEERAKEWAGKVQEEHGYTPKIATNLEDFLNTPDLQAVYVATSWETHLDVACKALEKGIAVAMEVGCAFNEEELWHLIDTYEKTKTPFMIMENCLFDKGEALGLKMARAGLFGDIVHMQGSYSHDLRELLCRGGEKRNYRLDHYTRMNCDNYPTHEIGPIAKVLNINRGNRFKSLVSIASKSAGIQDYIDRNLEAHPEYAPLKDLDIIQGDLVHTLITCENGETVLIKLDTSLPRFYARDFTIRGTKGFYEGNTNTVFIDGVHEDMFDTIGAYKRFSGNGEDYNDYLPDMWKYTDPELMKGGHGGMDYFEVRYFLDCLQKGEYMLADVYDAATWMVISVLTKKSIAEGGKPQEFPDFTKGAWKTREPKDLY